MVAGFVIWLLALLYGYSFGYMVTFFGYMFTGLVIWLMVWLYGYWFCYMFVGLVI